MEQIKKFKNKKFKPQQIPKFLGIFPNNQVQARSNIQEYVKQNLEFLSQNYEEDSGLIINEIQSLLNKQQNGMQWPQTTHVTSFYTEGRESDDICYQYFQEYMQIDVEIQGIIYVPNKIITGIAIVDQNMIPIKNKCPHMTLFINQWPSYNSNVALESLFFNNGPLQDKFQDFFGKDSIDNNDKNNYNYDNNDDDANDGDQRQQKQEEELKQEEKQNNNNFYKFENIKIENQSNLNTIYYSKFGDNLVIPCISKAFYSKNSQTKNKKSKGSKKKYK